MLPLVGLTGLQLPATPGYYNEAPNLVFGPHSGRYVWYLGSIHRYADLEAEIESIPVQINSTFKVMIILKELGIGGQ